LDLSIQAKKKHNNPTQHKKMSTNVPVQWNSLPTRKINMDDPTTMWVDLVTEFNADIMHVIQQFKATLDSFAVKIALNTSLFVYRRVFGGTVLYEAEIQSIATLLGLEFVQVLALQLFYEMNALCTSIVFQQAHDGAAPHHYRTMDWGMLSLRNLSIHCHFYRYGIFQFEGIVFAGQVGLFTACHPTIGSVALNYRSSNTNRTILDALGQIFRGSFPSSYILRQAMDTGMSYDAAKQFICAAQLVSPCYITLVGHQHDQACIVTRSPEKVEHIQLLEDSADGILAQANSDQHIDNGVDVMSSRQRVCEAHELAYQYLLPRASITAANMDHVFAASQEIVNSITLYRTVFSSGSFYSAQKGDSTYPL